MNKTSNVRKYIIYMRIKKEYFSRKNLSTAVAEHIIHIRESN